MSRTSSASSERTFDEEAECLVDCSSVSTTVNAPCGEQPSCPVATDATTRRHSEAHAVSEAAADVTTMGHAVRVPRALQLAARRTMLDVLRQSRQPGGRGADNFGGPTETETIPHNRQMGRGATENVTGLGEAVSSLASVIDSALRADLSRSLRHLLPSRRRAPTWDAKQQRQRDEQSEGEDSISDVDDNKVSVGNKDSTRIPQNFLTDAQFEANPPPQRHSLTFEGVTKDKGRRTTHQRSWMKLFDCDEPSASEFFPCDNRTAAVPTSGSRSMTRTSTILSRQCTTLLRGPGTDDEDEVQRKTSGRTSLATLLSDAEARDDAAHAQSAKVAACTLKNSEDWRPFTDVFAAGDEEDSHLLPCHSFGNPAFHTTQIAPGSGASVSTAFAALHGAARRSGGRSRTSTALKQLSNNPTSARVIAYLTRSFEEWKLDTGAICCSKAKHSTLEATCSGAGSLETSGVHLKLLVEMVETTFSLYCVRCEVVWTHAQVLDELLDRANTTSAGAAAEQMAENEGMVQNPAELWSSWTVVLTATAFRSIPIIVGEHMYLARPFFCYPAIRTIVASLNITSDAALRRMRPSTLRQRRSREANMLESESEYRAESRERRGDETSLNTTTPDRAGRPSVSLSASSPFRAYDPFVNPPVNLFCKNTATSIVPNRSSHGSRQRSASLPRRTVMSAENEAYSQRPPTTSQAATLHDAIGDDFPRGPGDEWDVPLEVLLALCPPRKHVHSGEAPALLPAAAADETHGAGIPPAASGHVGSRLSSSSSSLSSVEAQAEARLPYSFARF